MARSRDKKRLTRRRLLLALGGLLAVLAILIVLAPTIGGPLARGRVTEAVNASIPGSIRVGSLGLGWFGPQTVRGAELRGVDGDVIATVDVRVSAGLLGLATGSRDLGVIRVHGEAVVERDSEGVTNIERALGLDQPKPAKPQGGGGPPASAPGKPMSLPGGLKGRLNIDGLSITYTDPALQEATKGRVDSVRVDDVSGDFSFGVGAPLTGELSLNVREIDGSGSVSGSAGRATLNADIASLIGSSGRLTLDTARFDVEVVADSLPLAVADALGGLGGRLVAAVGSELGSRVSVTGGLDDLALDITASASNLSVDIGAGVRGGALVSTRAGHVTVGVQPLVDVLPQVREAINASEVVRIERWPSARVGIGSFHVPLGEGFAPDLRGLAADIVLGLSAIEGAATLPELGERAYHVDPLEIRAQSSRLDEGVTIRGGSNATIGGQDAGTLAVDVTVRELLDDEGGVRARPGDVKGRIGVANFRTAILEPLGSAIGSDLVQELGPVLDVSIDARQMADGRSVAELVLESANVNLTTEASIGENAREVRGRAAISVESIGHTLSRYLARLDQAGGPDLGVTPGSGMTIVIEDVTADLARLFPDDGSPADLRAFGALVNAEIGALNGSVSLPGDPSARPLELSKSIVILDATNPGAGARLRLSSSAMVGGERAGQVNAELFASGMLDGQGRFVAGVPSVLRGQASIADASTGLLQAVIQSLAASGGNDPLPINLPEDVGPTVTLKLDASQSTSAQQRLAITLASERVKADAALISDGRRIAAADRGIGLSWSAPGAAIKRWIPKSAPATLQDAGFLTVRSTDLAVPLRPAEGSSGEAGGGPGRPDIQAVTGSINVTATGSGVLRSAGGSALGINTLKSTLSFDGAGGALVKTTGDLRRGQESFTLLSNVALASLFAEDRYISSGSLNVRGAPVALAELAIGGDLAEARKTVDLITKVVGPSVGLSLSGKASGPGAPLAVEAQIGGGRLTSTASASLGPDSVELTSARVESTVMPETLDALLARLAPEQQGRVALVERTALRLDLEQFSAPIDGGKIVVDRATPLRASLRAPGELVLDVAIGEDDSRRTERAGVKGLEVVLSAPGSSLLGGGSGRATATINAALLGADRQQVGTLAADLYATLAGGRPSGQAGADVRATQGSLLWVGVLGGYGDTLARALGETFDLTIRAGAEFVPGAATPETGQSITAKVGTLEALLATPRVSMRQPVSLTLAEDRASASPAKLAWTMPANWINPLLQKEGEAAAVFKGPTRIDVDLRKLVLSRGQAGSNQAAGPLKPGVFDLDAVLTAPQVNMEAAQAIQLRNVKLTVTEVEGQSPVQDPAKGPGGALAFALEATEQGRQLIRGTGRVKSIADALGNVTQERAAIDADLNIAGLNTAVIDALSRSRGFLVDMLGPTLSGSAKLAGFGQSGGKLDVALNSDRASMNLAGVVDESRVFRASRDVVFTLTEITPVFGSRLTAGIPLATKVEKKKEDGPASVTLRGLALPLNGDLSLLNVDAVVDIGTARFSTGPAFAALLDVTDQKTGGQFGRKLQPFEFTLDSGVMTYDRYMLPLGEFEFDIAGKVDFVNRRLDIITFVPVGAMSDAASGQLNAGLGGLLGNVFPNVESLTKIPWRTSGSFGSTSTKPDIQLMLENSGQQLLRPDKMIERRLKDLLKGIGGGG